MAELPFDEDVMTLIMGLEGPEEPGQHGRKMVPAPQQDAIDFATQIRDLCEEFLRSVGKDEKKDSEEDSEPRESEPMDEELESE